MECLGPECAGMILDWLRAQARVQPKSASSPKEARQGLLWTSAQYFDEAPAITSARELAGAIEHLEYAVFRRYNNQLTRAERSRLDNTIDNALFKVDRYLLHAPPETIGPVRGRGPRLTNRDSNRSRGRREANQSGPPRRSQAGAARLAHARVIRGVRRRAFRDARLRSRKSGRLRRPGRRSSALSPRRACWPSSSASITSRGWSGRRSSRNFWERFTTLAATRDSSSRRAPSRCPPKSSRPKTRSSFSTARGWSSSFIRRWARNRKRQTEPLLF